MSAIESSPITKNNKQSLLNTLEYVQLLIKNIKSQEIDDTVYQKLDQICSDINNTTHIFRFKNDTEYHEKYINTVANIL